MNCQGKLVFYHHIVVLFAFLSCMFANGLYTNRKGVLNGEFRSHVIVVSVRCHFLPAFNRNVSAGKTFV